MSPLDAPTSKQVWDKIFQENFAKESDRAGVILAASILDTGLEVLLKSLFVSTSAAEDELFHLPYSPLSSFSAKINIAHRMGTIPASFARALHLVRRIRNDFAHDVVGCSFEDAPVKSRVVELTKAVGLARFSDDVRKLFPPGTKGDFEISSSWMIWWIWSLTEGASPLPPYPEFAWLVQGTNKNAA